MINIWQALMLSALGWALIPVFYWAGRTDGMRFMRKQMGHQVTKAYEDGVAQGRRK